MVQLISENIWYREGVSSPDAKLRGVRGNLSAMLENALMTQIDDKASMKKVGLILASFTVIKIVNHYYNDVGPDGKPIGFYDAILAGLGDLTVNAFKYIVGTKFDEMTKGPKAHDYYQKYVGQYVKDFLDLNIPDWRGKGLAIVKKYVEETTGLMAAKVYSKAQQVEITDNTSGGVVIRVNVWDDPDPGKSIVIEVDLMKIKDQVFDYIFNAWFSNFPFTSSPLSPPADPPYMKS
jgi:hypothetical protein